MTIQRMDHVGVVVDDLEAAIEFFVELGLELEGGASGGGELVDRIVGLEGVRTDFAFVRTPDGHGRLELVGELVNYEDIYWLCYVRGPDGIIVELAEKIG